MATETMENGTATKAQSVNRMAGIIDPPKAKVLKAKVLKEVDATALVADLCRLRDKRPTFRGGPDAEPYGREVGVWVSAYNAAYKALCGSPASRRCSDGKDRTGAHLADYIVGYDTAASRKDRTAWRGASA